MRLFLFTFAVLFGLFVWALDIPAGERKASFAGGCDVVQDWIRQNTVSSSQAYWCEVFVDGYSYPSKMEQE